MASSNFCKIGPKHIKIGFPTLYLSLSLLPSAAHVPPSPALVEPILSNLGLAPNLLQSCQAINTPAA